MVQSDPRAFAERERAMAELRREFATVERKLWHLENLLLVTILVVLLVGGILLVTVIRG